MIDRKELRLRVESLLNKAEYKNKTRKKQAEMFGITTHQINAYLSHNYVADKAIQQMGGYFGETVDNAEFAPPNKSFHITKPRNDAEAREKRGDKADMAATHRRWAIDEHQAKIKERELNYGVL